jgi:hypothetical protein
MGPDIFIVRFESVEARDQFLSLVRNDAELASTIRAIGEFLPDVIVHAETAQQLDRLRNAAPSARFIADFVHDPVE